MTRPPLTAASDRLLVWGGGGHGKVVADLARAAGHQVVGYADRDPAKLGREAEPGGARVVMSEDALIELLEGGRLPDGIDAVALAIGGNTDRARACHLVGARLAGALVHPSAAVSGAAEIGLGTVVFAQAIVNAAARVGTGVIVNSGAIVEHDCVLDAYVHVSPGAILCGGVRVGRGAWIGAGAVVIPGIRIGAESIVGAGAVVLRDVPDGAAVAGNPARPLGSK